MEIEKKLNIMVVVSFFLLHNTWTIIVYWEWDLTGEPLYPPGDPGVVVFLDFQHTGVYTYGWNHLNITCTSILRSRVWEGVRRCSIAGWKAQSMPDSPLYSNILKNTGMKNYTAFSRVLFWTSIQISRIWDDIENF